MAAIWAIEFGHLLFTKEISMSNLINPKPRFGYNPTTGQLYDYVAQKDVTPTAQAYDAPDGSWNLVAVKDAILAGQTIETGHLSVKKPTPPATGTTPNPAKAPAAGPAVAPTTTSVKPNQPTTAEEHPVRLPGSHITITGLSVEQLQALKLSPLQVAALGITPVQLSATGVTAAHVEAWHLTAARADALKLTPEQRAVLMP
jgi:hypothetical protein